MVKYNLIAFYLMISLAATEKSTPSLINVSRAWQNDEEIVRLEQPKLKKTYNCAYILGKIEERSY